MFRSHWRTIATLIGCLTVAGLIWWALRPEKPVPTTYEQIQKQHSSYRPGGSSCDPTQLRGLAGEKAVAETNRCAESAEQHRLQGNDLIQQTRAADAASASAGFALAAFYAKKAAEAAENSINHSRTTAQQELRAHLAIEDEKVERSETGRKPFKITFSVKNVGNTPANSMKTTVSWTFLYSNGGMCAFPASEYATMSLVAGATCNFDREIILASDESRAFREDKGHIASFVECDFIDDFGDHWIFRQALNVRSSGLTNGKVYTDHCEHVRSEKSGAKSSRPRALLAAPKRQRGNG